MANDKTGRDKQSKTVMLDLKNKKSAEHLTLPEWISDKDKFIEAKNCPLVLVIISLR